MSRPETPEECLEYIQKNGTYAAWEKFNRSGVNYRKVKISHTGPAPEHREFSISKWVTDNEESIKEFQVEAAHALYDAINPSQTR